jgi:hypothetical protein
MGNSVFIRMKRILTVICGNLMAYDGNGNIQRAPLLQKLRIANNQFTNLPGPAMVMTSTRYFDIGPTRVVDGNLQKGSPTQYGDTSTNDSILVYRFQVGAICGTELDGSTTGQVATDVSDRFVLDSGTCPAIDPR